MVERRSDLRLGLPLAVAAVGVNAPRLVLAFLEADGIGISPAWRAGLLGLTGIATGTVLTGGGAYLAGAVSRPGPHRSLLILTWLLVLTCAAVLVTPVLVAGLAQAELSSVLGSAALRWAWSAVAVLAVELVAAGAMVAHVTNRREQQTREQLELELLDLARERDRLTAQLRRPTAGSPSKTRRARARAPYTGEPVPCRNGCGFVGASPMAERGHQRSCPKRQLSAEPKELERQLTRPRHDRAQRPSSPSLTRHLEEA